MLRRRRTHAALPQARRAAFGAMLHAAAAKLSTSCRNGSSSMKAIWNGVVVAESDDTVVVEGNHYFPESSLKREFTSFSNHRSHCHWKGEAHYYSLFVNGEMNPDAVWYYPEPSEAAAQIKGRVAFWKGVKVVD
jgi:uncharacterized protein (DUF427 family)